MRDVRTIAGHAVRALYLAAGATDVAVETGDSDVAGRAEGTWETMVESQTYLTGGVGARWYGEAFGDPFELPPDAAYCETCAAIASVQWSWRLLLATGESRYADLIERTLYNAVISGVSLTGREFFYVNTLKVRKSAFADDQRSAVAGRQPWFGTACCPPNVMRTLSSLDQLVATSDDDGGAVAALCAGVGDPELPVRGGGVRGRDKVPVARHGDRARDRMTRGPWTLGLRIPAWADDCTLRVNGVEQPVGPVRRAWAVGDEVVLELPVQARRTVPDDRVDSVRGCVAIERGPLVYCFEQLDQDVVLDATAVVAGDLW